MELTKTYKDGSTPTVCIIGAGFSGMCATICLQTQLSLKTYTIFELEPEVGGTRWSNIYPGCACDIQSIIYQFSFEPNYERSKTFAGQQGIWEYQRRVTNKYNLYEKIRFRTEITYAERHEDLQQWGLFASLGSPSSLMTLRDPSGTPPSGTMTMTSSTSASLSLAAEPVPAIVNKVKKLKFYQRSATWVMPRSNFNISAFWKFLFKYVPFVHFIFYKLNYWSRESTLHNFSTKWRDIFSRRFAMFVAWAHQYWQVRDTNSKSVNVHTATITDVKGKTLTLSDGSKQEVDALILATGFRVQNFVVEGHGDLAHDEQESLLHSNNPKTCKNFGDEVKKKMKGMVWSTKCTSYEQDEITALWWSSCTHYWWRLRKFRPQHFLPVQQSKSAAVRDELFRGRGGYRLLEE
ncbi:hypothetical protein BGZ47_003334 [Haplosporangium gracile]|nr:hypothetical protein BGZ47_003334 [Haplosporangium gracile]